MVWDRGYAHDRRPRLCPRARVRAHDHRSLCPTSRHAPAIETHQGLSIILSKGDQPEAKSEAFGGHASDRRHGRGSAPRRHASGRGLHRRLPLKLRGYALPSGRDLGDCHRMQPHSSALSREEAHRVRLSLRCRGRGRRGHGRRGRVRCGHGRRGRASCQATAATSDGQATSRQVDRVQGLGGADCSSSASASALPWLWPWASDSSCPCP